MGWTVQVDGKPVEVTERTTAAAAVALAGRMRFRRAVDSAGFRAPLCGMGICFECRVTVDGVPHVRSCMTACRPGMEIRTDAAD